MKRFLLDKNYGAYLSKMGFSTEEILKKAMLPEDLFARQAPSLTVEEYFHFMQAIDALSPDEQMPIRLASSEEIETFSPPIFAAYCSRNALMCLRRLAQYKPLIGALLYHIEESENEVTVDVISAEAGWELPEILVGIEYVFIIGLIRKATKEEIKPIAVTVKHEMKNSAYADFIGMPIKCQFIFVYRNSYYFVKSGYYNSHSNHFILYIHLTYSIFLFFILLLRSFIHKFF